MARAPRSIVKRARHKKWLKRAKGYRGRRRTVFRLAKEAVLIAGRHAYRDRRKKKTEFRAAWQIAINAAVRLHGVTYSRFIHALKEKNITLNRKMLAQLAKEQPEIFEKIVAEVKK